MAELSTTQSLYEQVVSISREYLGPASRRFVDRQIRSHLNITPSTLASNDLRNLTEWIRLASAFLTEDEKLVEEFIDKLLRLERASRITQ